MRLHGLNRSEFYGALPAKPLEFIREQNRMASGPRLRSPCLLYLFCRTAVVLAGKVAEKVLTIVRHGETSPMFAVFPCGTMFCVGPERASLGAFFLPSGRPEDDIRVPAQTRCGGGAE
jgi:hypothetical protein